MKYQGLREIFRVTQWKDGCVYGTKSEGYAWVTIDAESKDKNVQYGALSTKTTQNLRMRTMRAVSDDTPDVVKITSIE